jgi:hypothetical protein
VGGFFADPLALFVGLVAVVALTALTLALWQRLRVN